MLCAGRNIPRPQSNYGKAKDTTYTQIIADKGINLHYRSAVIETYGAFGDSLSGVAMVASVHGDSGCGLWRRCEHGRDQRENPVCG